MNTTIKIDRLVRSKRRTLALEITGNAELIVRAPKHAPMNYIEGFIRRKQEWIRQKLDEAAQKPRPEGKKFVDGEEFFYLGKTYRLTIIEYGLKGIELDGTLNFPASLLPKAREAMTKWYRDEARRIISQRVALYAGKTGLTPSRIRISGAQKRWGSCGPKGSLNFSWRLVMAPMQVIDYLVVHELAHIAHHNHSTRYWDKVRSIMPDFLTYDKWLKDNQRFLVM